MCVNWRRPLDRDIMEEKLNAEIKIISKPNQFFLLINSSFKKSSKDFCAYSFSQLYKKNDCRYPNICSYFCDIEHDRVEKRKIINSSNKVIIRTPSEIRDSDSFSWTCYGLVLVICKLHQSFSFVPFTETVVPYDLCTWLCLFPTLILKSSIEY